MKIINNHSIGFRTGQLPDNQNQSDAGPSRPRNIEPTLAPASDPATGETSASGSSAQNIPAIHRSKRPSWLPGHREPINGASPNDLPNDQPNVEANDQPNVEPDNAVLVEYSSLPPEVELEVFKQTPAFDMVALARAAGKSFQEVLGNHLLDSAQKRDFTLANAPFMNEEEILGCIEKLAPKERTEVLTSLFPFVRSNDGLREFGRHVMDMSFPTNEIDNPANRIAHLNRNHGPKREPVLGALRNVEISRRSLKSMPVELRGAAKWVMATRPLENDIRTLQELDHDDQFKLLKKVEAWIAATPFEFEDYTKVFVKGLIEGWKSLPLESKFLALNMIEAVSNKASLSAHERIEKSEMLAILLEDATQTPHPPSLQKKVVRLVEDFYYKEAVSEKERVVLLKKLGSIGGKLNAARIYDVCPDHDVQGYAYQFFKQELRFLTPEGQANVASHWAKQNAKWATGYRPLTKKHWKNLGYATGVVGVASLTTSGIIGTAKLPPVTANTHIILALRMAMAKSILISGTVGSIAGGASGLAGADDFGPMAFTSTASWITSGWVTPVRHLYKFGLSVAASGTTASVAAGWMTGFAAGKASYEILSLTRRAIIDEGGVKQAAKAVLNNPVSSVQTAVQRTAAEVFSFNRLPQDPEARAQAVQELGPHWLTWVEAISSFPPNKQAALRADLAKVFNPANYTPETWQAVNDAIEPARAALEKKVV